MKRIIKVLELFIVMILFLVFTFPANTYALTKQTSYVDIRNIKSLEVGGLSFTGISFRVLPPTTQSFELFGNVNNSSNDNINYISTVYYYNSNYKLIAQEYKLEFAKPGLNYFRQMSNLTILDGHSINEIKYYRLSIEIVDSDDFPLTESSIITPSKNKQYNSHDYVIDKYDINIKVNENNTFDIVETITAYYNVSKHGLIRTIPLKNTITRLDGTTSTNHTQVTNVSVDNEYKATRENGNYKLKIGSANHTLTGEQTYVIKYRYNLGKDPVKNYDELYYNVIGNGWDTVIGNVTFSITMPKEFDSSKLGFSSGRKGSTDNSKIKYNVSGNKITGSYCGILDVGEALTVRCELPEGYFVGAGLSVNIISYILLLFPILFLGISALLWYKFGRDEQVVETIECCPPDGLNSLEVGFLYKGEADGKDVTSLLIYLANKGYIKIIETEEESILPKFNDFKIIKLKEYDGDNINEQLFLKGLFTKKSSKSFISLFSKKAETTTDDINEVTSRDLYDNFYITMKEILSNMNNKENKNKVFEKSASVKKIFVILMIIATYCLITISPFLTYGDVNVMPAILLPGFGFTIMFFELCSKSQMDDVDDCDTNSPVNYKIFILEFAWGFGMFGGVSWTFIVLPVLLNDFIFLIGYIIGVGCVFGMTVCLINLPKRTTYGNKMLGRLKGFRNFLKTSEKEKLESFVMKDPTYFYDILPYTYVLGLSDKWINKFESISLHTPFWYETYKPCDIASLRSFMDDTMVLAQGVMSSGLSSSSGDSSGGGSSGGGSGGGGGSSW